MNTRAITQYMGAARRRSGGDPAVIERLRRCAMAACMCDVRPSVVIDGRTFCFTGKSPRMRRPMIAELLDERGGIVRDRVSRKTDYLVVCSEGSAYWRYGVFGRKLLDAMAMRAGGGDIRIVCEDDFWRAMG